MYKSKLHEQMSQSSIVHGNTWRLALDFAEMLGGLLKGWTVEAVFTPSD